ncbi:MAG: hypothetical protein NTY12_03815 [Candidatus Falkowbacteria bacterium]|nr:hypothetical protein [Candidatus Falkowbacteria bacterium]
MNFLDLKTNFLDPENMDTEIVERKGLGHPDTLADALAELISMEYSKYCIDNFGYVLHHNVDKFYIGAGFFKSGFGFVEKIKPVQVFINGRMSDSFGGHQINVDVLQRKTILSYLQAVLPNLASTDVVINSNVTQNSQIPYWFQPRGIEDLPEYSKLTANDNAVCVASYPLTTCEDLVYSLEEYFWNKEEFFPSPRFKCFGQDIKVMAYRNGNAVNIGVRVPVISTFAPDKNAYNDIVAQAQKDLSLFANELVGDKYRINLEVNANKPYMLGIGSCIECGEEGVVGRGNSSSGLISMFRPHSTEAPSGKNPKYHTGRVMNYLVTILSKAIYDELGVKNSVIAMTKNGSTLIPPYLLSISTGITVDKKDIERLVTKNILEIDYVAGLLRDKQVR